MPCIDSYQKVDLRTVSFDVPPQEVKMEIVMMMMMNVIVFVFLPWPILCIFEYQNYPQSQYLY